MTFPANSSILLQSGTVLFHEGVKVNVLHDHDVLIEGSKISSIGKGLVLPTGGTLVDCRSKIVSPGFIDAHHHLWQSPLKGSHGDLSILDYMVKGNMQSYNCTPEDIFWGQLSGCLQSIDGGVTTVVDHAHVTYSNAHVEEALRATESSGLRSIFCYAVMTRFKEWTATAAEIDEERVPDWCTEGLTSLAKSQPFGHGRVSIGLAFDIFSLPREKIIDLYKTARASGIKMITCHYLAGLTENIPQLLADYGILSKDVHISHCCGIEELDTKLLREHGASIASTPEAELQMGLGEPVAFRDDVKPIASIGLDCHSNNSSDILTQLRLSLQHYRGTQNYEGRLKGEPPSIKIKIEEAFNLATIQGAKAINLADEIGSIAVGKRADVVIFESNSPSMVCAAQENPLEAILLHASVRDIDTVIIDGKIRKQAGRLTAIELSDGLNEPPARSLPWDQLVHHLLESRLRVKGRAKDQSHELAREALAKWF